MAQNKENEKKPFLSNVSNFFKKSSDAFKEKISTLFKKKVKAPNDCKVIGNQANIERFDKIILPSVDSQNKQVFKIEEDEEGKTYNLNEEFSDDDEYEDDEEDTSDKKDKQTGNNTNNLNIQNNPNKPNAENDIEKVSINKINTKKENSNNIQNQQITESSTKSQECVKIESPDLNIESSYDIHSIAHRIYYKGAYVNLSDILTTKYVKRKSKGGILSMMGFGNKKVTEEKYLMFFDEYYIYTIKDIEVSSNQPEIRKIGNRYDIRLLQNTSIERDQVNNKIEILLEFQKSRTSEETKEKKMIFEESDAVQFINLFNIYLKRLNINFFDEEEEADDTQENSEKEEINKSEEYSENKERQDENISEEEEKAIDIEK